jgi:hypothetical protein
MNMLIEIFVRSFSTYMDVETCRDIVQHPMCASEATEGLAHEALIDFRGRLFSQEDSLVLERVLDIADKTNKSVKIHDLSRVTDNFSALRTEYSNAHGNHKRETVQRPERYLARDLGQF